MILSCHDSVGPSFFGERGELHDMSIHCYTSCPARDEGSKPKLENHFQPKLLSRKRFHPAPLPNLKILHIVEVERARFSLARFKVQCSMFNFQSSSLVDFGPWTASSVQPSSLVKPGVSHA